MWNIEKFVSKGEYMYAVVKDHPKAIRHGYVLAHRVIMENHLGRILNDNEVVHHINGDKKDNNIGNLEVMDAVEHNRYHALKQGKWWADLVCPNCGIIFTLPVAKTRLVKGRGKYNCCSKKCRGKFSSTIQYQGKTPKTDKAISENILAVYKVYTAHTRNKNNVR